MRENLNCPNCGAPITQTVCPYCGTVFYDFTVIDADKPSYILTNWGGRQMAFRALARSAEMKWEPDAFPTVNIEFIIYPDDDGILMKDREIGRKTK